MSQTQSEWEEEFFKRWRAKFEYEARGFEACLNDSYHSKFAQELGELEALLESADETVELKIFTGRLLEQLLQIAALSPKLPREWLNSGRDDEEELDTDSFYLTKETENLLKQKLNSIFRARLDEILESDPCDRDRIDYMVGDIEEFYSDVIPGLHAWNLKTEAGMTEAHFFWHLSPWHWTGHLIQAIQSLNTVYYFEPEKTDSL